MPFSDKDLMSVMNSEINRYTDDRRWIQRAPSLDEIDGDFESLIKEIMEG